MFGDEKDDKKGEADEKKGGNLFSGLGGSSGLFGDKKDEKKDGDE